MANILCIETATEICSVCISVNGTPVGLIESSEPYSHSSQLTSLIIESMASSGLQFSDLDAIAVSSGPGSYTGLRVGFSTAKGLCFGLDIPFIGIDTLESMASSASLLIGKEEFIFSSIDARRLEVYAAIYDQKMETIMEGQPVILDQFPLDSYLKPGAKIHLCGNGSEKTSEQLKEFEINKLEIRCSAKHMTNLSQNAFKSANFSNLAYFSPNYLKPPGVTKPKRRLY